MPEIGDNWKCPYCEHAQVISEARRHVLREKIFLEGWKQGKPFFYSEAIACSNADCRELSFNARLYTYIQKNPSIELKGPQHVWSLLPTSRARVLPHYIPEAIRRDYEEACSIRDLSPKAAATIVRRCLQGMIRDFCQIKERNLASAIKKLKARVATGKAPLGVQADTVDAIDHVRKIGNIGAHMEANIDVIVDVDPNEAQKLVELAELLFDEWYIARERRSKKLVELGVLAEEKKQAQKQKPASEPVEGPASSGEGTSDG